jgi:exonuclease III
MSANTGGSRGVASFWKQPPLDVHSDVVIEQLIKETAQVPTVTTAAMEIKICNLYAPNNGKDSSAVFNELKSEPVTPMLHNSRRLQLSYGQKPRFVATSVCNVEL